MTRLQAASHLAPLILAGLAAGLGVSCIPIILGPITTDFQTTYATGLWVILAASVAMTALGPVIGRLGDLIPMVHLFRAGLLLYAAALIGGALAPDLGFLLFCRLFQGIAGAILTIGSLSLVAGRFGSATSLGFVATAGSIGTALGPALGGYLLAVGTWRLVFLCQIPLILAIFALSIRLSADMRPEVPRTKFDWAGAVLLTLIITLVSYGLTTQRTDTLPLVIIGGAVALLLPLFWRIERRAAQPILPLALIRTHGLGGPLIMSTLVTLVMMGTLVLGPLYLGKTLHLDSAQSGLMLMIGPLCAALIATPSGYLSDRIGPRRTVLIGLALFSIGSYGFSGIDPAGGRLAYGVMITLICIGYGLFLTPNNSQVLKAAGPAHRGTVSGLLTLSRQLGLNLGAVVMPLLSSTETGDLARADGVSFAAGFHLSFLLASIIGAACLLYTARYRGPGAVPAIVG